MNIQENRLLQRLAKECVFFLFFMLVVSTVFTRSYFKDVFAASTEQNIELVKSEGMEKYFKESRTMNARWKNTKVDKKDLGNRYIQIRKHQEEYLPVQLLEDSMAHTLKVKITHMETEAITEADISWVREGQKNGIEKRDSCTLKDLQYAELENYYYEAEITIQWDKVYTYQVYEDQAYIYIACARPKDVYKHVVVLDAGHGGTDTGTYALQGEWAEKDYNLDFVKKMKENWDVEDTKLYITREDDRKVSLRDRVEFANEVGADLFVSVHCNSTDEYSGSGLEALYKSDTHKSVSKDFAEECLKRLSDETGFVNRGVLDGNGIYIIRKAKMPTILLEMGFLTDGSNISYLAQKQNRKKMAVIVNDTIKERLEQIK